MIIAIDESGSFNKDSNDLNLFVAAHILSENGQLEIKRKQFENWENGIAEKFIDKNGEVKGQLLGKVELRDFLKNVVLQKPEVGFSIVSIIPKNNNSEVINKHHRSQIVQLDYSKELFIENNAIKKNVNFFDQFTKWLNKRNESQFLKMLCLKNCIYESFYNGFVFGIITELNDELINLKFKIDNDFISNDNKYWKGYLLKFLEEHSKRKLIPILDTWTDNHPVIQKYVKNGRFNLNIPFKENLDFFDSKDNFEIRIADIAAIIVNRNFNSQGYKSLYQSLRKRLLGKDGHSQLVFNDFNFDKTMEQFKRDSEKKKGG
ncbi:MULTISPECIES: hypothetical protein [Hwangdonia]|uniref:DUF3800 domain-containing protein n=1 Tax=Hwangdonia seohaensis TaxID=1240727 RepID=A0ABW3RDH9_9FLAO|nr:hypothetical protein [Hwangdonia seohaensis]